MLHLGTIRGTTIRVDLSFLILVAFFVFSAHDPSRGIQYALLWLPVLFLSVLIHELAHAAAIGLLGYGASEIVLGGMGGVTMNQRRARPWHDLLISVAGPLASFGLAWLVGFAYLRVPFFHQDRMMVELMPLLQRANLWWGIFNLMPVPPLDGGHAVRNFLRMFLTEKTSFVIAVWFAIIAGIAIAVLGLMFRWIFLAVLIAWYVFMNYQQWQHYRRHGIPGD